MSNNLKYEDPTLSNQRAESVTQLLQNGGNSKSKYLYSIKYIIPYKKIYKSKCQR
jgi:flagellar motor protein MotB